MEVGRWALVNNTHVLLTAAWRAVGVEENGSGGQGFPSPLQEFKKNLCHPRLPELALALPARVSLRQPSSSLPQPPAEKACRPEPCPEPRSPTDSLLVSFLFSFQICVRKPSVSPLVSFYAQFLWWLFFRPLVLLSPAAMATITSRFILFLRNSVSDG